MKNENKEFSQKSDSIGFFTDAELSYVNGISEKDLKTHLLHQVRLRDLFEVERDKFEKMYNELVIIQKQQKINDNKSNKMIVKTSDLGYDMSFYEVNTNATSEQLKEVNFSGLIPTQRSVSTDIKQLKEACEKLGYYFEYEIIAERLTVLTDHIKGLKIDYVAHSGNY